MKAYDIKWDVSDDDYDEEEEKEIIETLPKEVEIPDGMDDIDDISDWLSDEFGLLDDDGNEVEDY